MMMGGPLGAALGAAAGHVFDRGLDSAPGEHVEARERAQTAFFTATFSVMGHVAKADGVVSKSEIELATRLMDQLGLKGEQRKLAQALFTEGKADQFPLDEALSQFVDECSGHSTLIATFIQIQIQAAYADGVMHQRERRVLHNVASGLGMSERVFAQHERLVRAYIRHGQGYGPGPGRNRGPVSEEGSLANAYSLLGLTSSASNDEVRTAYRRLMSQNHPDKLVSQGLPDEMMQLAKEKTQAITQAYDTIKKHRDI